MKKLLLSCLAAMIMLTSCSNDSFICTFTKADDSYTVTLGAQNATGSVCIKKGE